MVFMHEKGPGRDMSRQHKPMWKRQHQLVSPKIARVVDIYFAVLPTSVAPKPVFFVMKKKNRLGSDAVGALVFLNGHTGWYFHWAPVRLSLMRRRMYEISILLYGVRVCTVRISRVSALAGPSLPLMNVKCFALRLSMSKCFVFM